MFRRGTGRGSFWRWKTPREDSERGAALVETAILIPLVILMTFGLIEFSSAYQSSSTAASTVRSAARTASAEAKLPNFATDAAAAAATALQTIPSDEPVELWVYNANSGGFPLPAGNTSFASCSTQCIKYTWLPAQKKFDTANPSGGGWDYLTMQACNAAQWDSVGVYVKLRHKYITKLFGATIDLSDHAVFRLEPAPTQLCT